MKYDGTKTLSVVYMMQSWLSHKSDESDAAGVHAFLVKKGQAKLGKLPTTVTVAEDPTQPELLVQ